MSILGESRLRELGPELLDPFDPDMVQPASIDVHVDKVFYLNTSYLGIQPRYSNDDEFTRITPPCDTPFVLPAGGFALGSTFEKVHIPLSLVARFEGKSSLGRLGLSTHITAGFIDPGFQGHITVELKNETEHDWWVLPGMKIGQICFEELDAPVVNGYGSDIYGSHYQHQRGPTLSKIHKSLHIIDVYSSQSSKEN